MENEILKACKDTITVKKLEVLKIIQQIILLNTEETETKFAILIHLIGSLRQFNLRENGLDLTNDILEALNFEFDSYKNLKCHCEKCRCYDHQSTDKDRERSE
jgi:hypothetical protein